MKVGLLKLMDVLVFGFILLIGCVFCLQGNIPFLERTILVVGLLAVWLIACSLYCLFSKILWKKNPNIKTYMQRSDDERAQMINEKARNYSGRLLQALLFVFSLCLYMIFNETTFSLLVLLLCGVYEVSYRILKTIFEKRMV